MAKASTLHEGIADLMPHAKEMASFIHDNGFDTIVVGGSSATVTAYMVKTWWVKLYPKQKMPSFISLAAAKMASKSRAVIRIQYSSQEEIAEILRKRSHGTLSPEKNVFVLEEYAATGTTIRNIGGVLRKYFGVKKVSLGTLVFFSHGKARPKWLKFAGTDSFEPTFFGRRRELAEKIFKFRSGGGKSSRHNLVRAAKAYRKKIKARAK